MCKLIGIMNKRNKIEILETVFLTVCKQMSSDSFKKVTHELFVYIITKVYGCHNHSWWVCGRPIAV